MKPFLISLSAFHIAPFIAGMVTPAFAARADQLVVVVQQESYSGQAQVARFEEACTETGLDLVRRMELAKRNLGLSEGMESGSVIVESKYREFWNGHSPVVRRWLECRATFGAILPKVTFRVGRTQTRKGAQRMSRCEQDQQSQKSQPGAIFEVIDGSRRKCAVSYVEMRVRD